MNPDYTLKAHYVGMYFQECFAEYAASRNVAAFDVEKRGLTWLTSDVKMEFVGQMPRWRELVDVDVWLYKTTAARMYVNFRMYHGSSEIARGTTIQLIADINTRRPVRAEQIAEAFDLDSDVVFDDPFGKITGQIHCVVRIQISHSPINVMRKYALNQKFVGFVFMDEFICAENHDLAVG